MRASPEQRESCLRLRRRDVLVRRVRIEDELLRLIQLLVEELTKQREAVNRALVGMHRPN